MGSSTTRGCPEFSFTDEEIRKFLGRLKTATKRVFVFDA